MFSSMLLQVSGWLESYRTLLDQCTVLYCTVLQVSGWLESYRTLLDQWTMFTERAELDIALTSAGCNNTPCQQVSIGQLLSS